MNGGRAIAAALCALALGAGWSGAADARTWRSVLPLERPAPVTVRADGVSVDIDTIDKVIDVDGESLTTQVARIVVRFPGLPPHVVAVDPIRRDGHGLEIGIGRLRRGDRLPVVVIEGYSGGAHCCATFQMVAADAAGDVRTLPLVGIDGGPARRFPRDIDGDGTIDILRQDDRFRYQFSSGAGSWSPPVVFNLIDGALVDVTTAPRYRGMWEDFSRKALRDCRRRDELDHNGACAAFAAAEARLGRAETGIATAAGHARPNGLLPEDCAVEPGEDGCPPDREILFPGFEPALRWFLGKTGYTG